MHKKLGGLSIQLVSNLEGTSLQDGIDEAGEAFGIVNVDSYLCSHEDPRYSHLDRRQIKLTGAELALARELFDEIMAAAMLEHGCISAEEVASLQAPTEESGLSLSLWQRIRRALGF